ncbi:MAG: S8 family serine peptidase, partial [Bacteroidota bacterium]
MRLFHGLPSPMVYAVCICLLYLFLAPNVSAQKRLLVKYKSNQQSSFSQEHVYGNTSLQVLRREAFPWRVLALKEKADVETILETLKNDPNVLYAEEDFQVSGFSPENVNDPLYQSQWAFSQTHPTSGSTGLNFGFTTAWDKLSPKKKVVVGVLDSGIDWDHPDLVHNLWQNLAEDADGDGRVLEYIRGKWVFDPGDRNGRDDDGNGYVDDFIGWDFVENDNDPSDENILGHGTHVSGIIGAKHDNGVGVAGAATSVSLMPLRFLDAQNSGFISDAISALGYAVDMGAEMSNHSWGGQVYSEALYDAILTAEEEGHLVVAAAGNNYGADNDLTPVFPASYDLPNIISVTAINPDGKLTSFSNIGLVSVDIAAPGYAIQSTLPGGRYGLLSGTSMAAPFVVGGAALLLAEDPGLSYEDLKEKLVKGVRKTSSLTAKIKSGGYLQLNRAYKYTPDNTCEVSPLFTTNMTVICPGTRFKTTNISEGATSYKWFVNGRRISTRKNVSYKVPSEIGGSPEFLTITLEASKGNCIETFSKRMQVVYPPQLAVEDVARCAEAAYIEIENIQGIEKIRWRNNQNSVIGRAAAISIKESGDYKLEVINTCRVKEEETFSVSLKGDCVWPGDITADGTVNALDFLAWGMASGRKGPARSKVSIKYEAQEAPFEWSASFPTRFDIAPGVNVKHADANGDGVVNTKDLKPISRHLRQECGASEGGSAPVTLGLHTDQQALNLGGELALDILLDGYNGADINNAYGLIFSVSFNMPLRTAPELNLNDSWMGKEGKDMRGWFLPSENGPGDPYCGYIAMTRTNRQGKSGGGKVGGLLGIVIMVDDLSAGGLTALSETRALGISVSEAQLVTNDGSLIPVGTSSANSSLIIPIVPTVDQSLFARNDLFLSHISAYPNPFTHQLFLNMESDIDREARCVIRDLQGKNVWDQVISLTPGANEKVLEISELASGVYSMEVHAEG